MEEAALKRALHWAGILLCGVQFTGLRGVRVVWLDCIVVFSHATATGLSVLLQAPPHFEIDAAFKDGLWGFWGCRGA
jgi:hypothetical protein